MHQKDLHPKKQSEQAEKTFNHRPLNQLTDAPPVEIDIVTNNRKSIPVEIRGRIIRLNKKEFVLGIFRDISERKKAEEVLKNSLTDLRLAQEIAYVGNWQLDPTVGIPVWSEIIYKIYERNPEDGPAPVSEYKNIYESDQYEIFSNAITAAIDEGKSYDIVLKLKTS